MFPRIGVCFAILGAALQLSAQVEQATILGTVTDSTAKVIPGASVTVSELGHRGAPRHADPTIAAITR